MMSIPEGVTVVEQWAVHSDDGEIYRVEGDRRDLAENSAALLQQPDEYGQTEPGAAPAHRYVMTTPHGESATGWRWTVGWRPNNHEEAS